MKSNKIFQRLTSVVAALALGVMGMGYTSAFAAEEVQEEPTTVTVQESESTTIELDSGVKVIITPITEDSAPQSTRQTPVSTTFDFSSGSLYGVYRYFSGNHFSVDLTTSSDSGSGNFTLKLMRKGTLWDTTVGTANLPQNGSFHVEFLNVYNPNTYRFAFQQDFGQTSHQYGSMTIYNWD